MEFIATRTTIPVPRVHSIQQDEDGTITAITMDYMPGKRLDEAWGSLDSGQKAVVVAEMKGYITQLRALKGTYIGALNHGPAVTGRLVDVKGGPFATESLFNSFLLGDIVSSAPRPLRDAAAFGLRRRETHGIVFTHADLDPGMCSSMRMGTLQRCWIENPRAGTRSIGSISRLYGR